MTKKTKKYLFTRTAIENKLSEIVQVLADIETYETSPEDVATKLSELEAQLEDLSGDLTAEA